MVYQSWEFDVKSLGTSQSQICIVFAEAEGAWTIYWLADPKDSSKYIFYEWVYKVIVAVSITPLYNKYNNSSKNIHVRIDGYFKERDRDGI